MMLEYLAPQRAGVDMGINLCGSYALVTKQHLYHPQIGTTFEQGCGKGVSQSMGRDRLCYASFNGPAVWPFTSAKSAYPWLKAGSIGRSLRKVTPI